MLSGFYFASHGLNSIAALHFVFRENDPYVCCVASFSGYYKAFVPIESGRVVHKGSVFFLGIFISFEDQCFFNMLFVIRSIFLMNELFLAREFIYY